MIREEEKFVEKIPEFYKNYLTNLEKKGYNISPIKLGYSYRLEESRGHKILNTYGMGGTDNRSNRLIFKLYKNRAVFLVSHTCPIHCRYCFRRKKMILNQHISMKDIEQSVDIIKNDSDVNDVILTGGDPLTLTNEKLGFIIQKLRSIDHVKIIRIDTKYPIVSPDRVDSDFVNLLKKSTPIFITFHILHHLEISPDFIAKAKMLADNGINLFSYTPLLKNINDEDKVLMELFNKLVFNRIIPYYLVSNVVNKWNAHFTVDLDKALELHETLLKNLSGIAVPDLIVYLPDGGGKVLLSRNKIKKKDNNGYFIENYEKETYYYKITSERESSK